MLMRLMGDNIELEQCLSDHLGLVLADAGQMSQVILNLALNGRDAMPREASSRFGPRILMWALGQQRQVVALSRKLREYQCQGFWN